MSETPRTDAAKTACGFQAVPDLFLEHARKLERENTSLRKHLHEIQATLWVNVETCRRIDAAIEAAEKAK